MRYTTASDETCRHCSHRGWHWLEPAKPPHHLKMTCGECERYIKFVRDPDKPATGRRDPDAWKWKPPTDKQLAVIAKSPKYCWVEPQNRLEAWQLVGMIIREWEAGAEA